MVLAALLLVPVFFTPLWSIGLTAPQYSDGLGMDIYVHDIRGHERHDLQNINILNHYIGMQEIIPEEIPELEIMPWVLLALILTGVGAGALGRPRIMVTWFVLFVGAGVAGMVDFYLWNIDYGHNLSPDAPIRIPGMTYSPPIIGTSQILNIRASSWPGLGTGFITLAVVLSGWSLWRTFRKGEEGSGGPAEGSASGEAPAPGTSRGGSAAGVALVAALLVAASGCNAPGEPREDAPGSSSLRGLLPGSAPEASQLSRAPVQPPASPADRMVFDGRTDPFCQAPVKEIRWGGLLETRGGETLAFASAGCLLGHLLSGATPAEEVVRVRVVDFAQGEKLIPAETAHYLLSPNRRAPAGPAGPALMAIETERMAVNLQEAYAGRRLTWDEARHAMAEAWGLGAPALGGTAAAPRP